MGVNKMDMAITNINGMGANISPIPLPVSPSNTVSQKESSGKAPQESATLSTETIKQMLTAIESHLQSMNISLSFSTYGEKSEDISVVVTDKDTGKVIREIPPKEIQHLYTKLEELVGIIFNHSV
jgi:flagellar protein FlaG